MTSQNRTAPRMRRLTITLVVLALMLPVVPTANADPQTELNQAQQDLKNLRSKAANAENELARVQAQAEVAMAELDAVEAELSVATSAYQTIADQTVQATGHLKKVEADLVQTTQHLEQRKEVLADRMRSLQEKGRVSYLEVLFGATSFSDFISRIDLVGTILRKDRAVFNEVKQEKGLLEEQKKDAAARKIQLETLQSQALAKQQEIEERKNAREVASRSLNTSRRQLQAQLDEFAAAESRINGKIAELQAQMANPAPASGEYGWGLPVPAPALVTSYFGGRLHPVLGVWKQHNGVDFNAPMGSPIKAVEAGVVIMASYDDAYGNFIVIDHGGGIATKYGHNSQLLVSVGQQVVKGQQIARAGATGWATGSHCHLEIIVNGSPQNYLDYIPSSWYTVNTDV
ncbi:MAG TPA: peptidoglycan DD-metalloendopeptidase family protein [Symbiobacteriaceae bacterium]|nr:peptidoglycan DD-metalloendopeptidase family protein [Symbiobacteriaceae bacterium]